MAYPTEVNAVQAAPSGNLGSSAPTHRQLHDQARSALLSIRDKIDSSPGGITPVRLVVPYYDYTSFNDADMTTIIDNPSFSPVVIVNVDTGPGTSANTDFQHEIDRMTDAGVTVVGYVVAGDVGSGPVAEATVRADVDKWYTFYGTSGIKGIFFDLTPTGASGDYVAYCESIAAYVHARGNGQTVIFNPGTYPLQAEGYFDPADIVCVWETDYDAGGGYLNMAVPGYAETWVQAAPTSKMLHLIYNVTSTTEMRLAMDKAVSVRARCFYSTSEPPQPGGGALWTVLDSNYAAQAAQANVKAVPLDPTDRREHHGPAPSPLLSGSATWDPASLTNGSTASTTVTVTGAEVGDPVVGLGHTAVTAAGWTWRARVSAADTVAVELTNNTGGTVDLASGTLRVVVAK